MFALFRRTARIKFGGKREKAELRRPVQYIAGNGSVPQEFRGSMEAQIESRAAGLEHLLQGQAPSQSELPDEITVGLDSLTGFLNKQYLKTYIPAGGSIVKCVTVRPSCEKTHFVQVMLKEADAAGFLSMSFSAKG